MLGTFFLCLGLLAYELLSSRILAIVVGSHLTFLVIAIAMLGLSAAASFVSLRESFNGNRLYHFLAQMCIALGISVFLVFFIVTDLNTNWSNEESRILSESGLAGLINYSQNNFVYTIVIVGSLLSIPYFLFGFMLSTLFRYIPEKKYHSFYFADLLGASFGCLIFISAMEYIGYQAGILIVLVSPFLATLSYAPKDAKKIRLISYFFIICIVSMVFTPSLNNYLEPKPSNEKQARVFEGKFKVSEVWRRWNSYTRVSLLELIGPQEIGKFERFSLGSGDGVARLPEVFPPYLPNYYVLDPDKRTPELLSSLKKQVRASAVWPTALDPKNVLVIFAGAGSDMIEIDNQCQGKCNITGVELNRPMVEQAKILPGYNLREFFSRQSIDLIVAEGREFLERDRNLYDSILISWSGASYAYYLGTSASTVQFLYTKEAFEILLDRLSNNGMLTILNANKARILMTLKEIYKERDWSSLENSVVILARPSLADEPSEFLRDWKDAWEHYTLLVRKTPFTLSELEKLERYAKQQDFVFLYKPEPSPGKDHAMNRSSIYHKILSDDSTENLRKEILHNEGVDLSIVTDDRPYLLDITPRSFIFTPWLWSKVSSNEIKGDLIQLTNKVILFKSLLAICLIALVIIIGPVLISKSNQLTIKNYQDLIFFFSIGTGFMFIEISLVHYLSLVLGNPGYSIAIVLCGLIFSTGVGSLISDYLRSRRILTFSKAALIVCFLLLSLILFGDSLIKVILPLDLIYKSIVLLFILFPLGFFLGFFFPQGLCYIKLHGEKLVAWAWAINGAASTIAACLAVGFAPAIGFKMLLLVGLCCYGTILLLPNYRKSNL